MDIAQIIAASASVSAAIGAIASACIAFLVYHRSKSPFVIAYIELNDGRFRFTVENIGFSPALDIRTNIEGKYLYDDELEHLLGESFIERGIAVLVPGGKRSTVIGRSAKYPTDQDAPIAKISYKSPASILPLRVRATFKLDWTSFSGSLYQVDTRTEMEKAVTKAAKKCLKEK